jgi:hypothetical protein
MNVPGGANDAAKTLTPKVPATAYLAPPDLTLWTTALRPSASWSNGPGLWKPADHGEGGERRLTCKVEKSRANVSPAVSIRCSMHNLSRLDQREQISDRGTVCSHCSAYLRTRRIRGKAMTRQPVMTMRCQQLLLV